jgi:NADP-dependent 3-hydroxy acid dehydrogenase YdfG
MRSVLITGTSSGIGLATAVVLASRGWRVFATMRNLKKRGQLDQALRTAGVQDKVYVEELDVTSKASIQAATDSILVRTGTTLDAVVHNAGVAAAGALEDVPESELRRVMETNFFGVLSLTRAYSQPSAHKGADRIVIISSEAAFYGQPTNAIYCASKWAIEGWAEATAYELEPFWNRGCFPRSRCDKGQALRARHQSRGRCLVLPMHCRHNEPRSKGSRSCHCPRARSPRVAIPLSGRPLRARQPLFRGKVPTKWLRKAMKLYLGMSRS